MWQRWGWNQLWEVLEGLLCSIMKTGLVLDILGTISKLPCKGVCWEDSHREDKFSGSWRSFHLIHMVCASPKHFHLEKIVSWEAILGQICLIASSYCSQLCDFQLSFFKKCRKEIFGDSCWFSSWFMNERSLALLLKFEWMVTALVEDWERQEMGLSNSVVGKVRPMGET